MEEKLLFYKEIYNDLVSITKKDEIDKALRELELFEDNIPQNILKKIETFNKPYPIPLFYFGLLRIVKIVLDLKKELFIHYDYYFNVYQELRKKEFKNQDENRLLNEVGEILYRMDNIDGKLKKNLYSLLQQIYVLTKDNKQNESIYIRKITPENYPEIYPLYEELIDILLNILDELKLEKGLYKLIKTFQGSNTM